MSDMDFVTTNNPAVFSFLKMKEAIPEYVLKSAKITKEDTADLDSVAFANPVARLYPCHTKEACWESAAFFAGTGETDATVRSAIEKMAAFHGISDDVSNVFRIFESEFEKSAAVEKKAAPANYALSLDFQGFQGRGVENFYPINNAAEVVTASDDCTHDFNAGKIPASAMRKVASAITEAAIRFNVGADNLTKDVRTYGTRNLPDPQAAEYLIGMRKFASNFEAYKTLVTELQEKLAGSTMEEAITATNEVAEKMLALDKAAGIRYNRENPTPYSLLFTGPTIEELEKAAATTINLKGINIPVEDFINLSANDIDVNFSKKSAGVIKEAKAFVENTLSAEACGNVNHKLKDLPSDTQNVLLNVLANTGW